MLNINVFDKICDVVEDYNNYASRRDVTRMSYEEKVGLFYNYMRRQFGTLHRNRRESSSLRSAELFCVFDSNGRLISFKITKDFRAGYSDWDADLERLTMLRQIKEVANSQKEFYQSRELNDMARIVNSIKTT
jgi:hypothetical protein